jgi:hypothetical protein
VCGFKCYGPPNRRGCNSYHSWSLTLSTPGRQKNTGLNRLRKEPFPSLYCVWLQMLCPPPPDYREWGIRIISGRSRYQRLDWEKHTSNRCGTNRRQTLTHALGKNTGLNRIIRHFNLGITNKDALGSNNHQIFRVSLCRSGGR